MWKVRRHLPAVRVFEPPRLAPSGTLGKRTLWRFMPRQTQTTFWSVCTSIERRSKKLSWTQIRSAFVPALAAPGVPAPRGAQTSMATSTAASGNTSFDFDLTELPRDYGAPHSEVLVDRADVAVGTALG